VKEETPAPEALTVEIDSPHAGLRLDQALSSLTGLSRSHVQHLLNKHHVEGPSADLKAARKVKAGEAYQLFLPPPEALNLEPEACELDILYEDEHLIVVNKPAGMVVHPGAGHAAGTLVHALLHHCPGLPGINGIERPGIVHRLDKDTSGSLVAAKTEQAHQGLVNMFSSHDMDRQYLAWCRGMPDWTEKRIELAIGRQARHRQKMGVIASGRHAITDALVERRYDMFCRLRLTLQTGRTHQIRVHLSHLGMPILGDETYGRSFQPGRHVPEPVRSAISMLKRQALHAEVLAFTHPVTKQHINCRAPLPDDLQHLSNALDTGYG